MEFDVTVRRASEFGKIRLNSTLQYVEHRNSGKLDWIRLPSVLKSIPDGTSTGNPMFNSYRFDSWLEIYFHATITNREATRKHREAPRTRKHTKASHTWIRARGSRGRPHQAPDLNWESITCWKFCCQWLSSQYMQNWWRSRLNDFVCRCFSDRLTKVSDPSTVYVHLQCTKITVNTFVIRVTYGGRHDILGRVESWIINDWKRIISSIQSMSRLLEVISQGTVPFRLK